jgi:hypothetical protein
MICPNCGKNINYLDYWEEAVNTARYDGDYTGWDTVEVIRCEYRCPECHTPLAQNRNQADKILAGEKNG